MGANNSVPAPPPSNDAWSRVRYIRIERADGRDEFINVARINAYYKNKKYTAIDGITSPPFPPFDWRNANNEENRSFAHTQASSQAHVQLDFGMNGVPVDKIHIAFRNENTDWNAQRRIGTRLIVQDWQGKGLFSYTFDHSSLNESVFVYPNQVPSHSSESVSNAWRAIRSMRIERADGQEEYINIARMNAYLREQRHIAVDGQTFPPYPPFTWQNANNESDIDTSIAHTGKSADAFLQLDFGERGVHVDRFYIGFRKVATDWNRKRRIGTRLVVKDIHGMTVIEHTFNEDPGDVVEFKFPSTVPVSKNIEIVQPPRLESIPDLPKNFDTEYGEIVLTAFVNDTPERIASQTLSVTAPRDGLMEKALVELIKTRPDVRLFGIQNGGEVWYDFKTAKTEIINPNSQRAKQAIRDSRNRPLGGPWLMAMYLIPDPLLKRVQASQQQPATEPAKEEDAPMKVDSDIQKLISKMSEEDRRKYNDIHQAICQKSESALTRPEVDFMKVFQLNCVLITKKEPVIPDGFDKGSYDAWLKNFVENPSLAENGKLRWLLYQLADTVCGVPSHTLTNQQKAFIERFANVCKIDRTMEFKENQKWLPKYMSLKVYNETLDELRRGTKEDVAKLNALQMVIVRQLHNAICRRQPEQFDDAEKVFLEKFGFTCASSAPKPVQPPKVVLPEGFDQDSYKGWLTEFTKKPHLVNGNMQFLFNQLVDTICNQKELTNEQKEFVQRFPDACKTVRSPPSTKNDWLPKYMSLKTYNAMIDEFIKHKDNKFTNLQWVIVRQLQNAVCRRGSGTLTKNDSAFIKKLNVKCPVVEKYTQEPIPLCFILLFFLVVFLVVLFLCGKKRE